MRLVSLIFTSIIFMTISTTSANGNSFLFQPDGADFYIYNYGQSKLVISQSKLAELNLDKKMSELSSSSKINTLPDDSAGSAVTENMNNLLQQLKQEAMNAEDLKNLNNFVDSSIGDDQEILKKIRLLVIKASSVIFKSEDREIIQSEIDQLLNQINMNAKYLQFNCMGIIPHLTSLSLGLDDLDVVRNLQKSMSLLDDALSKLTKKRIIKGIQSNILTFQLEGKLYYYLNLQRTEGVISDLDMAEGINNLIKNSVLVKTQYGLVIKPK